MFHVTFRARTELHEMLKPVLAHRAEEDRDLSFLMIVEVANPRGMALMLDSSRQGDEVVRHDGCAVLLYGPDSAGTLDGLILDVLETSDGLGFHLRH